MTSSSLPGTSTAVVAPPNLQLAVRRLAVASGSEQILSIGCPPYAFDAPLAVTSASEPTPAPTGSLVVTTVVDWAEVGDARLVVALDEGRDGSPFAAVAARRAEAAEHGWQVASATLIHVGAGTPESPRREAALLVACRAGDELAQSLETGPLSLALDPEIAAAPAGPRPARVLVASYEVTGPTGNGGIGTAYHSLAHSLAAAGNDVTVLFTGWLEREQAERVPEWAARFAQAGIDFSLLGTPWDIPVRNPHHAVRRAYEFHRWLLAAHAERPFDVVHLPEAIGHGAFALTAKALGLAYADVEFVIGTHSSMRWVAECNREGFEDANMLVIERLERISVARADVVLSPSSYLVDYMRERGWQLPERTFVLPYARPQSVRELTHAPTGVAAAPPSELIFFGRLETRKGLEAFCDAVDLLVAGGSPFEQVTFVGRPERVLGEESTAYISRRASGWNGLAWKVLPNLGHDEAIAYLQQAPCVVAIPSLVDNSPNTVYEAIALGVPFVASRAGGTGEIIAAEDLAAATFDGWREAVGLEPPTFDAAEEQFDAGALADALRAKAAEPAGTVSPAVSADACDRVYDRWHRAIAATERPAPTPPATLPTAEVHIVDADAEDVRRIASALLRAEPPPERVVALLDPAQETPRLDGLELVRAAGRATGAARRTAAAAARADLLIVLRGADDPDPELVAQVRAAMAASVSDVLSLVVRDHDAARPTAALSEATPREDDVPADLRAFVPAPGPAIAAAVYPALSVGAYAIRRSALERIGGYAADTWDEIVDEELLARAALAELRVDVLPEPLATTVRDDAWSAFRSRHLGELPAPIEGGEGQIRRLRPFRRLLDPAVADLAALLSGAQRATAAAIASRREMADAYETRIDEFNELVAIYERNLGEHRELIALYEQQKAELAAELAASSAASSAGGDGSSGRLQEARRRLRRATRPPVSQWPGRGVRFARARLKR